MLRIHQSLQAGRMPNASTLAREFEVSSKTIHRDLEFMRDRMDLPIQYDENRHGYFYTEEVEAFPTVQITEGELLALVIAEKAFQQYRGTHFERPLLSAIRKISEALPDTISLSLTDVQQTISFRTRAEPILDLKIFDELAKATANGRQLQLTYRKPGRSEPEERLVDPYHLANINGEWFLFAYDHLRKDMRTFVPSRIKDVKATGKVFKRPQKFSLERRLRGSFGVYSGQGEYEVVLRFNARAADYIREKKWHDSQVLKECAGGEVELQLKLSSLQEVERWVLSWGGDARVLAPGALADSVREAARRLLESTQETIVKK
jgi:predicted DNA-binding transcriptional regulator YafY